MAVNIPLLFLVLFVLGVGYKIYTKPKDRYLTLLPQVTTEKGHLAAFKSRVTNTLGDLISVTEIGYNKFSKLNTPFYLPGLHADFIILPPSDVKWLAEQPESIISAKDEQNSTLQTDWTFLDKTIMDNPLQHTIIRREMTRGIGSLIPEVEDEIDRAFSAYWGTDEGEWTDVVVFETMMKAVARATNRIFVGSELCRNEEYLTNCANFAQDITLTSAVLRIFPEWFKPLVAPLITLPTRFHVRKCAKHLIPHIKSRIANIDTVKDEDFLTWCIREAAASPDPKEELDPFKLVLRIMTVNFAAIHTSTFTVTNLLFDFFSSPTATQDIATLREEIEQVYSANGRKWDKASLAKLVKTDSALRESLRLSTFMTHGMSRIIAAKEGVTSPSGLHISQGTKIGTATFAIHHDDAVYSSARTYQPFRFSTARESLLPDAAASSDGQVKLAENTKAKILESKNLAAVTTNDHFLSFGTGKHACPGRFFASAELKMMLAYIMMNYDVQPLEHRPENKVYGQVIVPSMNTTIKIKRRKNPLSG